MNDQMTIALVISAATGWVIPAVVDVITKSHLRPGWKATIAAWLSLLAGAVAGLAAQLPGDWSVKTWSRFGLLAATAFVNAMSAHATGYSNRIQDATANIGVGGPAPADPLAAAGGD